MQLLVIFFMIPSYILSSELHWASKNENLPKVKELIKNGADVNLLLKEAKSDHEWSRGTPLHWASASGQLDVVKYLIANGANTNAHTYEGDCLMVSTPLDIAVFHKHEAIVQCLINSGANVEGAGHEFFWPLLIASRIGAVNIINILIDHGASIERTGVDGYSALHESVRMGHKESVKVLLKRGADVNSGWTESESSPLHIAAREGNTEIINILLEYGANTNLKNYEGNTPLIISQIEGNKEAILQLQKQNIVNNHVLTYKSKLLDSDYFLGCEPKWLLSASSTLKSNSKASYRIDFIEDLRSKTAWVEGVDGYGKGEYITYQYSEHLAYSKRTRLNGLLIVSGYAKSETNWRNNSRVKKIRIDVNDKEICFIDLKDSILLQEIKFPVIYFSNNDMLKITIVDIYPGELFKDTAITEMSFLCE